MKITDIRIRLVTKSDGGDHESKMRASASMTIDDCFVVRDLRIIDGQKGNFVAMPRRKTPNGEYIDIAHPIDTETRRSIEAQVLEAYDRAVAAGETPKD